MSKAYYYVRLHCSNCKQLRTIQLPRGLRVTESSEFKKDCPLCGTSSYGINPRYDAWLPSEKEED